MKISLALRNRVKNKEKTSIYLGNDWYFCDGVIHKNIVKHASYIILSWANLKTMVKGSYMILNVHKPMTSFRKPTQISMMNYAD